MANLAARVMPAKSRELLDRIKDLERTVAFLRSSRDLVGRASVDAGKSLAVRGILRVIGALDVTGTASIRSATGAELIRLGDMDLGDRGYVFSRENGVPVLEMQRTNDTVEDQAWALYDNAGNPIVSEEVFFHGLKRPCLEHPFQPVAPAFGTALTCGPYGIERTTSSAAFETLFAYDGKRQNAFLDLKFSAHCSDGTTAAELRVVNLDTGLALPDLFQPIPWLGVVPAGTTTPWILDPAFTQGVIYELPVGATMRLGVQARRTAGTGTVTVAVASSIGG